MQSSTVKKYAIYALGEIALVVLGILIALQINTWNEQRKDVKKTAEYMDRLKSELRSDSVMLGNHISDAHRKAAICKNIQQVLNGESKVGDSREFILNIQQVGRLTLPAVDNNTFEDLQSSGNLGLIQDHALSDDIRNYYNEVPYWWFDQYSNQLVDLYLPLVVEAIPMRIHEEILALETGIVESSDLFIDFGDLEVQDQDLVNTLDFIRSHSEYPAILKRIHRSHLVHVKLLTRMQIHCHRLIAMLK